jgi:hypothetical protein
VDRRRKGQDFHEQEPTEEVSSDHGMCSFCVEGDLWLGFGNLFKDHCMSEEEYDFFNL